MINTYIKKKLLLLLLLLSSLFLSLKDMSRIVFRFQSPSSFGGSLGDSLLVGFTVEPVVKDCWVLTVQLINAGSKSFKTDA